MSVVRLITHDSLLVTLIIARRDGPNPTTGRRIAAVVYPERPARLHGEAAGVGPSSEADAAAARAHSGEARAGEDGAAEAGRSREASPDAAQSRATREVRCRAVGRLRLRRSRRGAIPRERLHAARYRRRSLSTHSDSSAVD